MGFLTALWNGLKNVVGLILPLGSRTASARLSPGVRWVLHGLVVALVLIGLYLLNHALRIPTLIPGLRFLANVWLPILFLLMYTLGWLGWWLWTLLSAEEAASYYPEIDAAWDEAVRTLAQANIRLTDLPLFLVLGRPEGPDTAEGEEKGRKAEELLFQQAAQLNLVVKQAPQAARAPLHVYASREAVFVTCAGASLLGRQVSILAGDVEALSAASAGGEGPREGETLRPDSAPAPVRELVGMVRNIAKKGGQATEEERRLMRRLERRDRPQASLLQDAAAVADLTGRLKHLSRLIARDRQPYCPINGVLLLLPFSATDTDQDAQNTAEVCARDLQAVRGVLKVNCPLFALVCDLELTAGFREFIQRQTAQDRQRRVGQRFPMGTDLRGQPLADALEGSIHWLCGHVLREWVYRLFRVEATREEASAVVAGNARLYLLLSDMGERDERLSRILTKGIAAGSEGATRFGGCYLGGTGADAGQQAFVAGVFRKVIEAQNFVAWTEEAKTEDARLSAWARLGYGVLAGLGLAALAAVGWSLFGPRSPRP